MKCEFRVRRSLISMRLSYRVPKVVRGVLLVAAVVASMPVFSNGGSLVVDSSTGNSTYSPTANGTYSNGTSSVGIIVGDTGTGVVNASAYTLTSSSGIAIGNQAGSNGTYNLSGGTLANTSTSNSSTIFTRFYIGYSGNGTLNQTGGTLTSTNDLEISNNVGSSGTYNLSGGTATLGSLNIGYNDGGTLNVTGGTLTSTGDLGVGFRGVGVLTIGGAGTVHTDDLYVGFFSSTSTGSSFTVGGSGTLNVDHSLYMNLNSNGATANITGGTVTVADNFHENYNTGLSTLNISGGNTTFGGYVDAENSSGTGTSVLNLSGGSLTITSTSNLNPGVTSYADFGNHGTSTVNQTGGSMTVQYDLLKLGGAVSTASATYNLKGGTLNVVGFSKGTGSGTFNFNGGTLVAGDNSTLFMTGLTAANVQAGGALVNTNGFDDTIGQALLSGTTGSADGGLTKSGAGKLTLTGTNTYTGKTTVTGGALATGTTGTLGTGNVSVAAALSLGNTASIADTATLSFSDPSTIVLNAAAGFETVLSLLDSTTGKYELPGTYTFAQLNAFFGDSVFSSPNGETLTVVAVPEPTSMMLAGLAAGLVMRRRRTAR